MTWLSPRTFLTLRKQAPQVWTLHRQLNRQFLKDRGLWVWNGVHGIHLDNQYPLDHNQTSLDLPFWETYCIERDVIQSILLHNMVLNCFFRWVFYMELYLICLGLIRFLVVAFHCVFSGIDGEYHFRAVTISSTAESTDSLLLAVVVTNIVKNHWFWLCMANTSWGRCCCCARFFQAQILL